MKYPKATVDWSRDTSYQTTPVTKVCCPNTERYAGHWMSRDGKVFFIRPIQNDDGPALINFYEQLSDYSVYLRFLHTIKPDGLISDKQLLDICTSDCNQTMILVANETQLNIPTKRIDAVARLDRSAEAQAGEFAITIGDHHQGKGLGTELLTRIIRYAKDEGLERITYSMLPENQGMRHLGLKMGFQLQFDPDENMVLAELPLC